MGPGGHGLLMCLLLSRRDLSMNSLTELWPGVFHHLRFLEEL